MYKIDTDKIENIEEVKEYISNVLYENTKPFIYKDVKQSKKELVEACKKSFANLIKGQTKNRCDVKFKGGIIGWFERTFLHKLSYTVETEMPCYVFEREFEIE